MTYRLTCLTPTLVGDGQRLSPIDYMVWKDHVNVLDQRRIFRLLARGPRLDSYLSQLKKSDKLDFASWGGFAQNYAGRRIPFEHPSSSPVWERARAENLFIPTFASGPHGAYLPAAAVRGAFRTGAVSARAQEQILAEAGPRAGDPRGIRQIASAVEDSALGAGGANAMRLFGMGDSSPVTETAFKIYLLRVSTLEPRGEGKFELGWKQAPRGSARRPEDGTPLFAEMAAEGTVFEGQWEENHFLEREEVSRALRAKDRPDIPALFAAVNAGAQRVLDIHHRYAQVAGLESLRASIEGLQQRLKEIAGAPGACLLCLGWGAGFLSKTAFPDTQSDPYRAILRQLPYYARAIQSNLPFPKTRKILFLQNRPAALPGFAELRISE